MIRKHLETSTSSSDIVYLYLDNSYEISDDLYLRKDKNNLLDEIRKYLIDHDIKYKYKDIYLVIDNIIVGVVNKKFLSNKLKLFEMIRFGKNSIVDYLD